MPTALQGFRENNRERRGVGPPCQHSRAFSASGKGLKRWPLILSPTLRSAARCLARRASRRSRWRGLAGGRPSRRALLDIMMPCSQHEDMRTTLTLDDDVAAKLKAESRRAGRPFREIVNETLRRGLTSRRVTAQRQAFKIRIRDLGDLKPGLSLDRVAELIEHVEGSLHR